MRLADLAPKLLWIDCMAGAAAGATMIGLSGWLSWLEGLPREVLVVMGGVNLLYASYSFSLAIRARRPMWQILILVFANLAWAPVCLALAWTFRDQMTGFGHAHLVGEAILVGGLAIVEWTQRHRLLSAA